MGRLCAPGAKNFSKCSSPGKADPNPSSTHSGHESWATSTQATAVSPSHLPGGHSGVKGACGGVFPMSLSCGLGLTFRGFCLRNEQERLSILEPRGQSRQVLCSSAQSHVTDALLETPPHQS